MATQARSRRRQAPGAWRRIIDEYIAKALGNAFRQQILWILNERVASPSEIARELGEDLRKVCNHIGVLEKAGCVELAYVEPVGNRLQHYYRANSRAFLDGLDWPSVPDSVKVSMRATLLRNILDDAIEAVVGETYDLFEGSHMSWTPMILDEQGRGEAAGILERALREMLKVGDVTKQRLIEKQEAGHSYTVSIMGYPSIGGCKKVGPPVDAASLLGETGNEFPEEQETPPGKTDSGKKKGADKATGKRQARHSKSTGITGKRKRKK